MKCKNILTRVSKLKELDTKGLDQNTVMQIIEVRVVKNNTVKFSHGQDVFVNFLNPSACSTGGTL